MNQKIQDLILLLKQDRKTQVLVGAGVAALLFAFLHDGKPQHGRRTVQDQNARAMGSAMSNPREVQEDLLSRFNRDLEQTRTAVREVQISNEQIQQKMSATEERTAQIMKKMLEKIDENARTASAQPSGGTGAEPSDATVTPADLGGSDVDGLEPFGSEPPAVVPPQAPAAKRVAVVGAGDSARVKLLTSVDAPTDGTPYPVVLELQSDVMGPDGQQLALGNGRVVAAAQGSLTNSRVLFRLTSLNIRYPDGHRGDFDIDGWLVGEDGIAGMEGLLIDPIGKAISAAGMSGLLEGAAEGLAASRSSTRDNGIYGQSVTVTGNEQEYILGRGLGGAARAYSRIIENRVNRLVPQVRVMSGREGTVVFARAFKIPDLYDQLQGDTNWNGSLD